MKKQVFLTGIFLILSFSQLFSNDKIRGKVIDELQRPIEFATVAIFSLTDSIFISGTVTDSLGNFIIDNKNFKIENTFIQISYLGYQTKKERTRQDALFVLKLEAEQLDGVVVKHTLPKIVVKNDALVATIQNSVLSKAGSGNDVLQRLPLVQGDNGSYSIVGKGAAKIYINNREMRDASELENINSSDIKSVDIVTNPGAQYDASVSAVIRINLLKKIGDGFSFDIRSSYWQSKYPDYYEQLNINYRKKGLDLFGSVWYIKEEHLQISDVDQIVYADTLWTQIGDLRSFGQTRKLSGLVGLNYEISTKHNLGVKYKFETSPKRTSGFTNLTEIYANGKPYDTWNGIQEASGNRAPSGRYNAYYSGSFGDLKVDFNADYYTNSSVSESTTNEFSKEQQKDNIIKTKDDVDNELFASKITLAYPIFKGKFIFGGEYYNTHRDDIYFAENAFVKNSNTTIKEETKSAFAEYFIGTSIGQLAAGIRYENLKLDYFSDGKRMDESRKYSEWFPNLSISNKIKNFGYQLSYATKIERPSYRQLGNSIDYVNRFTLQSGNPYLKPAITHDVTFTGAWKILQCVVSYKYYKDAIIYWTSQLESDPKVSVIRFKNLDKLPAFSAFVIVSPVVGFWRPQLTTGIMKQWLDLSSGNNMVTLNKPMYSFSLNNSFTLPKGFLFTLDMSLRGKGDYQNVNVLNTMFSMNSALVKSFFKDKLRVELRYRDILNSEKDSHRLYSDKMFFMQTNKYDRRSFLITLRYKFNYSKSKYKGTNVGDEVINRFL